MQIGGVKGGRVSRGRSALRWLLALWLALMPLLSASQPLPKNPAPAGAVHTAGVQHGMPCHTAAGEAQPAPDGAMQGGCPHCDGVAPAWSCPCCGHMTTTGPASAGFGQADVPALEAVPLPMLSDALPESPAGRRFRPPIQPG